jgi:hypothetical protein
MLNPLATSLLLAAGLAGAPAEAVFTIRGRVVDATGAPVAAARVTAESETRGPALSTQTDARASSRSGFSSDGAW